MDLLFTGILVFFVNLPFGYLREGQKKFSVLWFVYIHAPVPLSILFRYLFDVKLEFHTFFVIAVFFFLGQFLGSRFKRSLNNRKKSG